MVVRESPANPYWWGMQRTLYWYQSLTQPDAPQSLCCDCLDIMPALPAASVDLILCDLPYGTTKNKWGSIIPLDRLWAEYWRVAKPNAAIVLTAQCPFDKLLGASCLEFMKYEWIWQKSRATGHLNAKLQPMKAHENVLVFYRRQPTYSPQGLARKTVPTVRKGRGGNGTNYGKSDKDALQEFTGYPASVLPIRSEGNPVHPTQKPVALMDYLIRTYTNEGDAVLDNCMGSGTTGVAAYACGRKFIGIEQNAEYFEIAKNRIGAKHAFPWYDAS
jgi:site-specific DNA-methyltransferase (adenine-specific)